MSADLQLAYERMRTHPAEYLRRMADLLDAGEIVDARPMMVYLTEHKEFRLTMRYRVPALKGIRAEVTA